MSTSRKRRVITLAGKKAIIEAAETETNKTKLAERFGLAFGTLCGILKEKEAILGAIVGGSQAKRVRLKAGKHEKMVEALIVWHKQVRRNNVPVSGDLIKGKALVIAAQLGITDFEASKGWLENFKHRHGIQFKTKQGEAGAVDVGSLREWQQQVLQDSLTGFSADDIFNADETGLFWQLLPNKTMAIKGDKCIGGKKSKERITVLVCANMSGTEKMPLLVIGKSAKPRCFKNHKVPVDYEANRKAWMTGVLFEAQLRKWDNKLKKKNRRVLLYLDNCSAYPPNVKHDNIKDKFFPPNTTALSQPMDQGVFQNLKVHYRKLLLRVRISELEAGKNLKVTLLDSLHMLRRAWDQVTKETIKNCFRHANFIHKEEAANEEEEADEWALDQNEEFLNAWNELQHLGGINEGNSIEEFMNVDDLVQTCGALTLAEIVEDVSRREEESDVSDSDAMDVEEVEVDKPKISRLEAHWAFAIARQYVEENSGDLSVLRHTDALDDYFYQERKKKEQQPKITNFFSSNR